MNAVTETLDQRSDEWLRARLGHATGSRFKDVMARLKSGAPAKARQDYALELATERITGLMADNFVSAAMKWGTEQEEAARTAYIAVTGSWVEETGFIRHREIAAGVSPDGLVDDNGMIEIKCPFNSNNHVVTMLEGMPDDHMPQVQGQMWITGRAWNDFCSFDPRMPEHLRLYRQRINRDDGYIQRLESEVRNFLAEVDEITAKLMRG